MKCADLLIPRMTDGESRAPLIACERPENERAKSARNGLPCQRLFSCFGSFLQFFSNLVSSIDYALDIVRYQFKGIGKNVMHIAARTFQRTVVGTDE